jgi:hypothetical protein
MSTFTSSALASMLDGFESFMVSGTGQATLTLYQTNTALCVFNLGASSTGTPFGSATAGSLALSSTLSAPVSNTGTAVAGTVNRFVIVNQNAATAASGTVSAVGGGGDIETPSLTVTAASTQKLNALTLRQASDGLLSWEGSLTLV